MKKILIVLFSLAPLSGIFADGFAYNSQVLISKNSDRYSLRHFHDCSALFSSFWEKTDQNVPSNPFLKRDWWYSYLELIDKESGRRKFKIASPIINDLFIDEENEVIIGMSKVMLRNPYSLALWDFEGNPLYLMNLRDSLISCPTTETVSNFFYWYGQEDTEKHTALIIDKGKMIGLRTLSIDNKLCGILFPKEKALGLLKMKVDYSQVDDNYTRDELIQISDQKDIQDNFIIPSALFGLLLGFLIMFKKKNA